jgi:CRISPR system Cascade subunit CasC
MRLIELHILQSFPVSCLNRDDVGSPKTAIFGGVNRARISSQCLKRAIREAAAEMQPKLFAAKRSRLFTTKITELLKPTLDEQSAEALAKCAAHYLGKLDPKDNARVKTLMFLSPEEFERLAGLLSRLSEQDRRMLCEAVARISPEELEKEEETEETETDEAAEKEAPKKAKDKEKPLKAKQFTKLVSRVLKSPIRKAFGESFVKDAADIAIFGRMVASDHSLTLDGAGLFNHPLSTHKAENDIDFFSAVDDLQPEEEAGAGMTGTLEFASATYYRYAALNLDLLWTGNKERPGHLELLSTAERKAVVDTFLRAAIVAVPGARKNSMNAHTLPSYVLGLVKDRGQPLQLVNAFEKPVFSKNGLMDASIAALKEHHEQLKSTWGIRPLAEVAIPDRTLDQFCEEIVRHVN